MFTPSPALLPELEIAQGMMGDACSDDPDCDGDLVCIEGMCDIAPLPGILGDFCVAELPCGEGLMCENFVCVMAEAGNEEQ